MGKGRLEAFSDGVIAIIITIMVLELKVPHAADGHHADLSALAPLGYVFLSYVMSFVYVGIYWNNHHHMLQAVRHVNGRVLWANLHLLFWLSLVPFATAWIGHYPDAATPTSIYGLVMFMAAIAYTILKNAIIRCQEADSPLKMAIGNDRKGLFSLACYAAAVPL